METIYYLRQDLFEWHHFFLYRAQTKHIVLNDTVVFLYQAQICEKNI